MTGAAYFLYLQQKYIKHYTGYFNAIKAQRIVEEAVYRSIAAKYRGQENQKSFDELSFFNKTQQVYTVNNNQIALSVRVATNMTNVGNVITVTTLLPHNFITGDNITVSGVTGKVGANGTFPVDSVINDFQFTYTGVGVGGTYNANSGVIDSDKVIDDYQHLYTIKCRFNGNEQKVITAITSTNPVVITIDKHNLRTGDTINISNVVSSGTFPINGTFTATKLGKNTISVNVDGTGGAYTSGGVGDVVYYNYATYMQSDQKITKLAEPTFNNPRVEVAEKLLKITPDNYVCDQITIDYMRTPPVMINLVDDELELEPYYTSKFLYYIADQIVRDVASQVKDQELYATSQQDIIQNP